MQGMPATATVKDLGDSLFLRSTIDSISEEAVRDSATNLIPANTVLICTRMAVGKVVFTTQKTAINQDLKAAICKDILHPKYLLFFLLAQKSKLESVASGATVKGITLDVLEELQIPLPSLEIQRRIANVLERTDRMRRLRQHALEMSDTYLQSVFLEIFGSVETNSKNWDIVQLEELCERVVDCPHSTPKYLDEISPYPCIRSSDLQNGYLDFSTTKYVSKDEYTKRIGRTTPVSGDILYCREGARYGNGARVPKNIKACLGQRVMLFRVDQTRATSAFFWALILSPAVRRFADNAVSGSASPHINVQDIREFPVFCPPLELQEKFARIVQTHEHLRAQQLEAHRQAQHLYDTLLHQAFTGQLDTQPEPRALQASLF